MDISGTDVMDISGTDGMDISGTDGVTNCAMTIFAW